MKKCTRCETVKPLDEYGRKRAARDGRTPYCKACKKAYNAEYYANNAESILAQKTEYYTENKEVIRLRSTAYRAANQERISASGAKHYAENRERIRAQQAEYFSRPEVRANRTERHAANPHISWEANTRRRAKRFGYSPVIGSFTKEDLIAKYGDECAHCGGPFEELDHYPIPLSRGGHHVIENCRPSCMSCNRKSWLETS